MSRWMVALLMLLVPLAAFLGGGWILNRASGRQLPAEPKPLNMRWKGYDATEAAAFWQAVEKLAPGAEKKFLLLDLVFPFLYAGALAAGLLLGWSFLGLPCSPVWLLAPVVLGMLADWTENLIQLQQLARFTVHQTVEEGGIRIAGAATSVKLAVLGLSYLMLALLILAVLVPGLGKALGSR